VGVLSSGLFPSGLNWPSIKDVNGLAPLSTTDSWDTGSIRFTTHIDAYGHEEAHASVDAICRLVSIAIIQRLHHNDLKDAYSTLVDSFYWTLQGPTEEKRINKPIKRMVKAIKRLESRPVVLDGE
jgi:hypothetical protein